MKRMQALGMFLCGALAGGLVFGGTAAYAASILAEPSTQPIFIDGEQVQMQAYAINGNNYVKLRDIGKAVGFNVSWDAASGSVQIDSDSPYTEEATVQTVKNADGSINIQDSDLKLALKVGDVVRCNDGTNYEIRDMSRYDANAFASGPLPPLPEATCDWGSFPAVELPEMEARRYNTENGDYLFIRNLYESRRMQYTIQNLAGSHPETGKDGKLLYGSKGTPKVRIQLTIDEDMQAQSFWPWRASELEKVFLSCPIGTYAMEAWDVYADGIFQYTEYMIYAI